MTRFGAFTMKVQKIKLNSYDYSWLVLDDNFRLWCKLTPVLRGYLKSIPPIRELYTYKSFNWLHKEVYCYCDLWAA